MFYQKEMPSFDSASKQVQHGPKLVFGMVYRRTWLNFLELAVAHEFLSQLKS